MDEKVRLIAEHMIRHIKPISPSTTVEISRAILQPDNTLIVQLVDGRKYHLGLVGFSLLRNIIENEDKIDHALGSGGKEPPAAPLREPKPAVAGRKNPATASKRKKGK